LGKSETATGAGAEERLAVAKATRRRREQCTDDSFAERARVLS
jgi:hypothetical protein